MKRQWIVHRQFQPCPDGEQRWDRAYQYLLQWAMLATQEPLQATVSDSPQNQEVDHANSCVCAGFHSPAN